jgi:hypothetical protein
MVRLAVSPTSAADDRVLQVALTAVAAHTVPAQVRDQDYGRQVFIRLLAGHIAFEGQRPSCGNGQPLQGMYCNYLIHLITYRSIGKIFIQTINCHCRCGE